MLGAQIATDLHFKSVQTASGELGPASRGFFLFWYGTYSLTHLVWTWLKSPILAEWHNYLGDSVVFWRVIGVISEMHLIIVAWTWEKNLAPSENLNVAKQLVMKKWKQVKCYCELFGAVGGRGGSLCQFSSSLDADEAHSWYALVLGSAIGGCKLGMSWGMGTAFSLGTPRDPMWPTGALLTHCDGQCLGAARRGGGMKYRAPEKLVHHTAGCHVLRRERVS